MLFCKRVESNGLFLATGYWRLATGDWRLMTGDFPTIFHPQEYHPVCV